MNCMDKKIIILAGQGNSSIYMFNGLSQAFNISKVIIEDKGDRKTFLKRRVKRLGYLKVFGQILFQLIVPRILELHSKKRINEIMSEYELESTPIPSKLIHQVSSVNSKECIRTIRREKPDIIVVNGTRIISKRVLECTDAIFINTHVGITPKYRGVHGGYWALVNRDIQNCGVTVHIVDSGIDTGGILYQKIINITSADNFLTYTYIQIGEGIKLMKRAISDHIQNCLKEIEPNSIESNLYYHPTLWYYVYKRITTGVK